MSARIRQSIKESAEDFCDEYDEAMIDEFLVEITDQMSGLTIENAIDEDFFMGLLQNFKPKDKDEWCLDMAQSRFDDYCDQKYEEERDARMGL